MNKRFLSTLLTGAIFLAATSMFVSCKDYDDDIKNLQSQIDKAALKSEVDALQSQLTSVSNNASAAMTKAEQAIVAAAAAQKTADAAATKEALEAVKKTAEDAAASAANAIKAAADAQKTADAAATKEALEAVKKTAEDAAKKAEEAAKKAEETYATKAELEAAKVAAADAAKAAADAAAAAKELAEAAQAAADKAQVSADDAAKIAAAAKELAEAETKAVAAQAAADAAQKTADDAAKAAADLAKQLENYATLAVTDQLAEDLNAKLDALKADIEAAAETNLEALALVVAGYGAAIDELYKAVSSVELIASYSGVLDDENEALQFPLGAYINSEDGLFIDFVFGKQKFTSKFGDKETESLFEDADQIVEYTEGQDIRAKQALLVRVNPVNASFTKDQVKLIDSKGRNLDEIITIGEPYRYTGLITDTRSGEIESGLWVIPVSVKENTALKDFNLITFNEREYYASEEEAKKAQADFETDPKVEGDPILYAVAINNTMDDERYVASTYDVAAEYTYFKPVTTLDVNLTAKNSDGKPFYGTTGNRFNWGWDLPVVHNRWTDYVFETQKPGIQSKDQSNAYTEKNPEQMWSLSTDAKKAGWVVPADVAKKETDKLFNTANDTYDYRFYADYFTIESVGQKISLELPEYLKEKAEYWYITFDFQKNAVESAPSEWEAWQSYRSQIDGIYTMTRGAEKINLVINAATAQGDVIGFRAWAVNYDGSLLDPDGKAFYVKVGDIKTKKVTLTAEVLALNEEMGMTLDSIQPAGKTFEEKLKRSEGVNFGVAELADDTFEALGFWDRTKDTFTATGENVRDDVTLYWALFQKDKKTLATNWSNIKYLVVGVKGVSLKDWLDNSTLTIGETFKQLRNESSEPIMYELTIAAKKVMPTAANIPADYKFIWKPDYDPTVSKVLTVYPVATADAFATAYTDNKFYWQGAEGTLKNAVANATWTALAVSGERKMEDYVSGEFLANEDVKKLYSFAFAGLPTDKKTPASAAYATDWNAATNVKGGNTVVQLFPAAIDHGYATNLNFTFKNISGTKDSQGWTTNYDYAVAAQSFTTQFKDAVDLLTYTTEYTYPLVEVDANGTDVKDANNNLVYTTEKSDILYVAWVTDALDAGNAVTKFRQISSMRTNGVTQYTKQNALLDIITLNSSAKDIVLAYDAKLLNGENMANLTPAEKKFRTALYNIDNTATTVVEALSFKFTGNVAKYIEPADAADIEAGYKKKGGAANPTENMTGSIVITGYDTFGKKHDFEFPIVILFDK